MIKSSGVDKIESNLQSAEHETPDLYPKISDHSGRWLRVTTIILLTLIIVLVASVQIIKQRKKADRSEAMSNLRSVYYLMIEFDGDYGEFPGDATATDTLSGLRGQFSNDYLRQFIVAGYTRSEEIFYAKRAGARKPDNAKPWIGAGECGYALVIGLSSRSHHESPILMAPVVRQTLHFDHDPYDGYAVILRVDGSWKSSRLNRHGEASASSGGTLFEGGKGTEWGDDGFDRARLKYPE